MDIDTKLSIIEANKLLHAVTRNQEVQMLYALLEALEHAEVCICILHKGRMAWVNNAGFKIIGYTTEELKAFPSFVQVIHPDDRPRVQQNYMKRLAGEDIIDRYTIRLLRKDGTIRPVAISTATMPKVGDDDMKVLIHLVDISELPQKDW